MVWKLVPLITFLCVILGYEVAAVQYKGVSSYAILSPRYPCSQLLRIVRKVVHPGINALYGTFGINASCLSRIERVISNRPNLLEIFFSNEVCRRNGRCYAGELFPNLSVASFNRKLEDQDPTILPAIAQRYDSIDRLLNKVRGPNTQVLISFLEDNFTDEAYVNFTRILRGLGYQDGFSRNPVAPSRDHVVSDAIELHGLEPSTGSGIHTQLIANNDGEVGRGPGAECGAFVRRFPGALARFIWDREGQGYTVDKFTLPRDRHFRLSQSRVVAYQRCLIN